MSESDMNTPAYFSCGFPVNQRKMDVVTGPKASAMSRPDTAALSDLLVAVAKQRDKTAFAHLFTHYAPRIKSYLMRQGASNASAEELSQEAMLSVWRKADRYDPAKAAAGTWIFTVARNLRIDALRKENRPSFDPYDPAFIPEAETSPESAVQVGESQARVRAAVATLPEEHVAVVRLSFYEEKSHREIAQDLNLPMGTVKSRLRLAMRKVRIALGEEQ
jgi:RNA polymerase sigma-70 factor (ECF subfamily)